MTIKQAGVKYTGFACDNEGNNSKPFFQGLILLGRIVFGGGGLLIIRQESLFFPLNWRAILQKKYGECPGSASRHTVCQDSNLGKPERMYDI